MSLLGDAQVQAPVAQLGVIAFKQPLKWLPVLCALLKQSNGGLAPEVLSAWQQSLRQALCNPPVQLLVSKEDHSLFWHLTCASQLSHACASSEATTASIPSTDTYEDGWQVRSDLKASECFHASRMLPCHSGALRCQLQILPASQ